MQELSEADLTLPDWLLVGRTALESSSSVGVPEEPLVLDTKPQSHPCLGGFESQLLLSLLKSSTSSPFSSAVNDGAIN